MRASRGEIKIEEVLAEAGLTFKEEYSFPDLKADSGRPLRFDFVVFDDDGNIDFIIEYQGKQEEMFTTKSTVAEIMQELGYVGNRYAIDKDGDISVAADMHIRVTDVEPVIIPAQPTVETGQGAMSYSRHMTMEATAYIPSDGGGSGITATGMVAQHGVIAVDPQVIPLGTRVYIPGYGVAIAADTGGAIRGNRIDLCMNTYREAINFGRGDVEVYILD